GIGSQAGPARYTHIHALFHRFRAQVLAPFPARHIAFNRRVLGGQDAQVAVAAEDQGPDVTGIQLIHPDQFVHGRNPFLRRVRNRDAVNLGGIDQPPHVFGSAEHRWTGGGRVTADPLENRTAVAGYMRQDVDLGIVPCNKFSVVPDLLRGFDHEIIIATRPLVTRRRLPHPTNGGPSMRVIALLLVLGASLSAQLQELKPGWNLFTPQQDIQMGKEAAAEVEKTMPVVKNEELTGYIAKIGARLAKSPHAGTFPFSFEVINDKSINAFALPGGPIFVHTGLISALDNESQLAGVLAHEMSHVALRHGTNQASKANLLQLGAMIASSGLGDQSIWSRLGQLGIGLGAQSVLLKYSR